MPAGLFRNFWVDDGIAVAHEFAVRLQGWRCEMSAAGDGRAGGVAMLTSSQFQGYCQRISRNLDRTRRLLARTWTTFLVSGIDCCRGADVLRPYTIRRIASGHRSSAPWPKSQPEKRNIVSEPFRAKFRLINPSLERLFSGLILVDRISGWPWTTSHSRDPIEIRLSYPPGHMVFPWRIGPGTDCGANCSARTRRKIADGLGFAISPSCAPA